MIYLIGNVQDSGGKLTKKNLNKKPNPDFPTYKNYNFGLRSGPAPTTDLSFPSPPPLSASLARVESRVLLTAISSDRDSLMVLATKLCLLLLRPCLWLTGTRCRSLLVMDPGRGIISAPFSTPFSTFSEVGLFRVEGLTRGS